MWNLKKSAVDIKKNTIQKIQKSLARWYQKNRLDLPWRKTDDPYRVWISEVMLQQTRIETVIPYYNRFMDKYPEIKFLAESDLQSVLKIWEGLGYYARARNMHKAAQIICEKFQGRLPDTREGLLKLPGIGEYISAAIASISFRIPAAVVDGNVKRVLARLFMDSTPTNDTGRKNLFESYAAKLLDQDQPGDFNQAVMELGQRICRPGNPICSDCPVQEFCKVFQTNRIDQYPVRVDRKSVPLKKMNYAIVFQGKKCLLLRRPAKGLLGGLWELPGYEQHHRTAPGKQLENMICRMTGIRIRVEEKIGTVSHAYTHFKVAANVYLCFYKSGEICLNGPTEHQWILPAEIHHYPCHKLIHKIFPMLHGLANQDE
ncbi:MAG: A/G-specific adenine glycosylase [Desulfobacterium sp.]|nr:A/G-specific adenine glycosylase [Desulfobacterium sp.]